MGVLSDRDIRRLIREGRLRIKPFSEEIVRENGLDLRVGGEYCHLAESWRVYVDAASLKTTYIDPVTTPHRAVEREIEFEKLYSCGRAEQRIVVPPHARMLLTTMEEICLPEDVVGFVNLRSTLARLGLATSPTIIDAGFCGQVTIELIGAPYYVGIPVGMRFLHVVLVKTETPVERPYKGKYQGQKGVTLPKPDPAFARV